MSQGMIGQLQQQQQQQGRPQQQPQQQRPNGQAPGGQPGGGGQSYPANAEEASQFANDIMRALYSEGQPERVMKNLTSGGNLPEKLGQTASSIVMGVLGRRREQTGRKPHFRLVILGLKKALEEMSEMMVMAGLDEPTPEILQEASKVAGQLVESSLTGGQGQQPQQQQRPSPQAQAVQPGAVQNVG